MLIELQSTKDLTKQLTVFETVFLFLLKLGCIETDVLLVCVNSNMKFLVHYLYW